MLIFRTNRKEDPLIATLERLDCPIFIVERMDDRQFQFVHLSRYFVRAAGMDPARICHMPLSEVFPDRLAHTLERNFRVAMDRPVPTTFDQPLSLDGRDTWWRTTLSRVPNGLEDRPRLVGLAIEISDAKARELKMTADMTDLKSAYQEVRTIAGLTVEDMRAPLENVVSLVEIVLEGFKDMGDGKRDMIAACMDVANASINSIDLMLDRVQSAPLPADTRESVSLPELCDGIMGLLDPAGRLTLRCPEVTVATDPIVLHALLRHLLKTAALQARAEIEVTLEEDAPRGALVLRVSDDGPDFDDDGDPISRAEASGLSPDLDLTTLSSALRLLRYKGGALKYRAPRNRERARFELTIPGSVPDAPGAALSA